MTSKRPSLSIAWLGFLLPMGCGQGTGSAPPPPAVTPAPSPRAVAGEVQSRDMLVLALAKTDGSSPVEDKIRKLEQILEKDPSQTDVWVVLGEAWIRKARSSCGS